MATGKPPKTIHLYKFFLLNQEYLSVLCMTRMWWLLLLSVASADFAVVGDWGRGGTSAQKQMAATFKAMKPDFVVSTGDNFYPTGIESSSDVRSFAWAQTYDAEVPWYLCLGNHDYYGNASAQLQLTHIYEHWNMPSRYFSKRFGDLELWFIDTTPLLDDNPVFFSNEHAFKDVEGQRERISEQYTWLEIGLSSSTASRRIIVGHHPLWTFGEHVDERNSDMLSHLERLMRLYSVESYICGHDHNLQYIEMQELHSFISGGGAWSYDWDWFLGGRVTDDAVLSYGSSDYGFLWVSGTQYSFYDAYGQLLFTKNLSANEPIHVVDMI